MKKRKNKIPYPMSSVSFSKTGFTLVEIMIVTGIAVMLTSILIIYTRSGEKQIIFFKEQIVLVSTILRSKAFAIETFQPNLQRGINKPPTEIVCGWGVNFDKINNKYTIFKDLAPVGEKDCSEANRKFDSAGKEKFEEFILPISTEFGCMALFKDLGQTCSGDAKNIDVVFVPPDPRTEFFPKDPNIREAVIVLELKDKSRESIIRITRSGQISFK